MNLRNLAGWALALVVLAGIIWSLPGCATRQPETPQQVINEAQAIILTVKTRIHENLVDRVWTPQKALELLAEVETAERDVDAAKLLLEAGKGLEASSKAGAARTILRSIRKRVEG